MAGMQEPTSTGSLSRVQSNVVARIVDYVQREHLRAGHRLTEHGLAAEVGVSRSPIRAALRVLAEQGVVVAAGKKGCYLARDAGKLRDLDLSLPKPSDERLYERIARDRMRNRLPEQFTEAEFMRRYGVSRAPLVRALTRLSQEGFVQRSAGHGWLFLPVLNTEQDYVASYRFRMIIEPAGLLEPTFAPDRERLERSREAHGRMLVLADGDRLDGREIFRTNAEFHEMLAGFSGNRFILQAVQQQNRLRQLSEYYVYEDVSRVRSLCHEHFGIMSAVLDGDLVWAASLLRRHLEIASRIRTAFVDQSPDDAPG